MQTRLNPIKIQEKEYKINKEKYKIKLFDLDNLREKLIMEKYKKENAELDILNVPALNKVSRNNS